MKIDYLDQIREMDKICDNFKIEVLENFYGKPIIGTDYSNYPQNMFFCFTPLYQRFLQILKSFVEISNFLGIRLLDMNKKNLEQYVNNLENPPTLQQRKNFEDSVDLLKSIFISVKNEVIDNLNRLEKIEKERLNEAIHCYMENCFYSAIAISVSTIEFRLLELMKRANPEKASFLEKLTLGKLISEYLDNKENYKSIVPERHEALLVFCNTYRIFSVHPKKEEINKRNASSVLNMTFDFLLDKSLIKN